MGFQTLLELNGAWQLWFAEDPGEILPVSELFKRAQKIEARVPGNVESDMMNAGLLPDPYVGLNILETEKLEYYHYIYVREFDCPFEPVGDEIFRFEGVDTFAAYYLNGERIAETANMLIEHLIPAKGLRKGRNTLMIHLEPSVLKARENEYTALNLAVKYNYDSLYVRKSPSMYGWDIMPRLVSAGIWRPVSLIRRPRFRLTQAYLYTLEASEDEAYLNFFYEAELGRERAARFTVEMRAECEGHRFEASTRVWGKCGKIQIRVKNPRLWWPKGYGPQNLYRVTAELKMDGVVVDAEEFHTGIRTVRLDRTSHIRPDGEGRFCFYINERPVFVLGTNWVPPDALPSRGDERAPKILELTDDIGCNAIRIWGGSRYETDEFYDLCDRKGILVWHDFMMACGNYPQTEAFRKALAEEIRQVIRRLRRHPGIFVWSGDNECDMNYSQMGCFDNPNNNVVTRETVYRVVLNEDFTRPYLPSSPYVDDECYRNGGLDAAPENHLWGPRGYFKDAYYRKAPAVFAGEMGYHGCPSPESIRKFISPEALWPFRDNKEWILHATSPDPQIGEPFAYRIELMANQVQALFGNVPDNLEDFALAGQIVQAEAFKYFIERFRAKKPLRSGIIWWNICDGWPQFSDAVTDYYFTKKLAYSFIKRSQQPFCLMIDDDAEDGVLRLMGVNDTGLPAKITYSVVGTADGRVLAEGTADVGTDAAVLLTEFPEPAGRELFLIRWSRGEESGRNTFLAGRPPFDLKEYAERLRELGLLEVHGFTQYP